MTRARSPKRLTVALSRFASDERGATAVEYGLIAGLVAVAAIVAFVTLGNGVQALFGSAGADTMESAASTASGS